MAHDRYEPAVRAIDAYVTGAGLGPGVAVGLTHRERPLGVVVHGTGDVLSDDAISNESAFQVGSISKSVTAVALLRLGQDGEIDLRAPVTDYLDWFAVRSDHAPITIHHLLTHTAGIAGFIDTIPSSRLAVHALRDTTVSGPPGSRFHYSNMGYMALGLVLEAATGRPYADAVSELVFEPLEMADSAAATTAGDPVRGHTLEGADDHYVPLPRMAFVGAHASVSCSARDLATFLRMLLRGGTADGDGHFLTPESFAAMTDPGPDTGDPDYRYGYGVFVGEPRGHHGHRMIQHGGENPGFEAVLLGDLDAGLGVVVLVNSYNMPWQAAGYALEVIRAVGAGGPIPDPPRPHRDEPAPVATTPPGEGGRWDTIVGHYQAHAPLVTDFRVFAREDHLVLETNGLFEQHLEPVDENTYLIGGDASEVAHFDVFLDGVAQRATIGGGVYARVDVP
jgi:CubicO group peptidase (beta-lactamase class C family)